MYCYVFPYIYRLVRLQSSIFNPWRTCTRTVRSHLPRTVLVRVRRVPSTIPYEYTSHRRRRTTSTVRVPSTAEGIINLQLRDAAIPGCETHILRISRISSYPGIIRDISPSSFTATRIDGCWHTWQRRVQVRRWHLTMTTNNYDNYDNYGNALVLRT